MRVCGVGTSHLLLADWDCDCCWHNSASSFLQLPLPLRFIYVSAIYRSWHMMPSALFFARFLSRLHAYELLSPQSLTESAAVGKQPPTVVYFLPCNVIIQLFCSQLKQIVPAANQKHKQMYRYLCKQWCPQFDYPTSCTASTRINL